MQLNGLHRSLCAKESIILVPSENTSQDGVANYGMSLTSKNSSENSLSHESTGLTLSYGAPFKVKDFSLKMDLPLMEQNMTLNSQHMPRCICL